MEQFNYFWWDGGFESVHNRPDEKLNSLGIAHILTPFYRFDISRFLASPCGISTNKNKDKKFLYGSVLSEPVIKIASDICINYEGKEYRLDPNIDKNRSLMVYDSGTVCHQLRLKGLLLYTSDDNLCPELEVELVFYLWKDLISFSVHVVKASTRQLIKSKDINVNMKLSIAGGKASLTNQGIILEEESGGFVVYPVLNSRLKLIDNSIIAQADEGILCMHILPIISNIDETIEAYKAVSGSKIEVNAKDLFNDISLPVKYDAVSGAIFLKLPDNFTGLEERIKIYAKTELNMEVPLRFLVSREGKPRIMEDGTILTMEEIGHFNTMGSFPMARKLNGSPSGNLWQVSIDGHEFGNYPKPYTHRWLHLYSDNSCTKNKPFEELLDLGWAKFAEKPVAQFCQLSLLGWDDNPHYGNLLDKTAVQLWHQGLINHQEILCICPESHMTDSTITDIRPIDQRNAWGPNNGGGDFLRYRLSGNKFLSKMRAARCNFPNYGPLLGTVKYHMTSEEDAINGEITLNIVAGDDIARVFVEASYEVVKDIEVEELTLIWLGCPGYDKSRYARFAWGKDDKVIEDGLVEIQNGAGSELIDNNLQGGEWFAAYRGGIIDEQFREPNGNKGLVYRGGSIKLAAHQEAKIRAKRLRIDSFDGLTTQFWIGVSVSEKVISLKKGDTIKVAYEYVPVLKYASDYGLVEHYSETYKEILSKYPDSYQPIAYEAKHGSSVLNGKSNEIVEGALFPTISPKTNETEFQMIGGSGWTPLRILFTKIPDNLILVEECEDGQKDCITIINKCPTYQLEYVNDNWVATILIKGGATSIEGSRLRRKFRLTMNY